MAFLKPFQDPSSHALAPAAIWDVVDVDLQLREKHAVITLWVWYDAEAFAGNWTPIAKLPPRTLRPDEFDQLIVLQPLPSQVTLAEATKAFAFQVLQTLPEFAGAQLVA